MRRYHFTAALVVALLALFALSACGRGNDEPTEASAVPAIRTPIPTFTPTNLPENLRTDSQAAPDTSAVETSANTGAAADTAEIAQPFAAAVNQSAATTMTVSNESAPTAASLPNQPGVGGPQESIAPLQPVHGTINTELVNSRTGPGTSHPVVIILGRGEEYDITGKTAAGDWVRICCIEQKEVWMAAEFITAAGSLDALPVAQAGETSGLTSAGEVPAAAAAPAAEPAAVEAVPVAQAAEPAPVEAAPVPEVQTLAATSAPESSDGGVEAASAAAGEVAVAAASGGALQLVTQEQFPENQMVRIFLFVYQGTDGLEGYSLRVERDGVEQPTSAISFGGRPGLTWPIADDRQRFQNLKVEFPGVPIGGVWTATPMKDGQPAGPTATFTLADGGGVSELYIRYALP